VRLAEGGPGSGSGGRHNPEYGPTLAAGRTELSSPEASRRSPRGDGTDSLKANGVLRSGRSHTATVAASSRLRDRVS
jgi:hypothetical protein